MADWYRNAIVYSLDVGTFKDADGDGIGDFDGLTASLDYLVGLGVDCIWLLPVFDTPDRDNGYDVRDYYTLDARMGNFGQFARLLEEAHDRGMHVLLDLPVGEALARTRNRRHGASFHPDRDPRYDPRGCDRASAPRPASRRSSAPAGRRGSRRAGDQADAVPDLR